jgi:hypothetical protein
MELYEQKKNLPVKFTRKDVFDIKQGITSLIAFKIFEYLDPKKPEQKK